MTYHLNHPTPESCTGLFLPPANKVWGKVICLQVCVCPQGWGVPGQVHPPGPGTPPEQTLPREQTPLSRTPGTRYTPPEQTPPGAEHAGRYGQRAGGTHPTGMQSCLGI